MPRGIELAVLMLDADHATRFRRAVSLNVRIDDSDDRLAPAVLEILGIVGPALGDAGE